MDPKDIVIERVTTFSKETVAAVAKFVSLLSKHAQPFTDESLQEIINSPQSFLFIARHTPTQEIAGMIMETIYRIPDTKKAYIDDLYIDEKFRKMGIATKLMQQVVATAKEQNAVYVAFTSRPDRVAGNTLYQKLGFTQHETNNYRLYLNHEEV